MSKDSGAKSGSEDSKKSSHQKPSALATWVKNDRNSFYSHYPMDKYLAKNRKEEPWTLHATQQETGATFVVETGGRNDANGLVPRVNNTNVTSVNEESGAENENSKEGAENHKTTKGGETMKPGNEADGKVKRA